MNIYNEKQTLIKNKSMASVPIMLGFFLIFVDVLAFLLAQKITLQLDDVINWFQFRKLDGKIFLVLGITSTIVFFNRGLYTDRTPWWSQVQYLSKVILFSMVTHIALSVTLQHGNSLLLIVFSWVLSLFIIVLLKATLYHFAKLHPQWKIPTVIISEEITSEDLLHAFNSDLSTGYFVHTIFIRKPEEDYVFDISTLPAEQKKVKICYGQEDHSDYIQLNPNNFYIISLDTFRDTSKDDMISLLNQVGASYALVPTLSKANMYQMQPKYFFGHDVVMLYLNQSTPAILGLSVSRMVKRSMDISVAGIGLIMIAPVIMTLAVCLKIEGQNGSLFYGGRRIGRDGKFFNCWKLRSMEPNAPKLLEEYLEKHPELKSDWEKYRKLPNDPRVTTKTARLIRKASLDELPQIWNIFIGDMSLVGPRPILEDELHYFDKDTLQEYLSIRPGLTGLWQVSGRNKTSFKRRVYWDSWYVRNWSLWGDIVILIKTPIILLTRKGAS
jgi:Undecaprenyl-phosphate galactose phosphotransferase WbaP